MSGKCLGGQRCVSRSAMSDLTFLSLCILESSNSASHVTRSMANLSSALLYLNGQVINRNEKRTPQELLRSLPKGAYTSLRVEKLKNVLEWNLHLKRLSK